MPRKRKVQVKDQENVQPVQKVVTVTKKKVENEKPSKKQKIEPSFATGDGLNVIKIILSIQKSDCNSNKCMNELTKLYKQVLINLENLKCEFKLSAVSFLDGS